MLKADQSERRPSRLGKVILQPVETGCKMTFIGPEECDGGVGMVGHDELPGLLVARSGAEGPSTFSLLFEPGVELGLLASARLSGDFRQFACRDHRQAVRRLPRWKRG